MRTRAGAKAPPQRCLGARAGTRGPRCCRDLLGELSVVQTFLCGFWARATMGNPACAPRVYALRSGGYFLLPGILGMEEVGGEEMENLQTKWIGLWV